MGRSSATVPQMDGIHSPALPNTLVMPIVRYRLSLVERVARALDTAWQGAAVVTDLPHFLQGSEWLRTVVSRLPLPSNILVQTGEDVRSLPITPADAACMAIHRACVGTSHPSWHCIDDALPGIDDPGGLPDPDIALGDDSDVKVPVQEYFRPLWAAFPSTNIHPAAPQRAARIAARLMRATSTSGRAVFICDWRMWPLVENALTRPQEPIVREKEGTALAAILPEDPLLLWQTGYMDDFPALTEETFDRVQHGLQQGREAVTSGRSSGNLPPRVLFMRRADTGLPPTTKNPATEILDPFLEQFGHLKAARVASRVLAYPEWTSSQLVDGALPRFGTIRRGKLEGQSKPFPLPDVFGTKAFYRWARAEISAFGSEAELRVRRYWGASSTPPVTRREAAIAESVASRWSVPSSYEAIAEAASVVRARAQEQFPTLKLNLFTPCVWIFSTVFDGDHRSVQDVSVRGQRQQLEFDLARSPDEVIYTLSATRSSTGTLCQGVTFDLASTLAMLYTGRELGPERYKIVTGSGYPCARVAPDEDDEFQQFELKDRSLAFAIRYASDVVLVCHHDGFGFSDAIGRYAEARRVQLVPAPLSVLPARLLTAVQTRIFVARETRFSDIGARLSDRAVNWRLPVPR